MKPYLLHTAHSTLKQTFNRRLLLLLVVFSLVMSTFIVLAYQHQTGRFNREGLDRILDHMVPRIKNQQKTWEANASLLFKTIEWSGILNLSERARNEKLTAFLTAQEGSLGFEGVVITDAASGKLLFDYWNKSDKPDMHDALQDSQPLWFDDQHVALYTKVENFSNIQGHNARIIFFKAWDNAMLNRLVFPGTTAILFLGTLQIINSAGNLSLESSQSPTVEHAKRALNGIEYQEGSINLADVPVADGRQLPLMLTVRAPIKNLPPIPLVLAASVGVTMMFGALLFVVFGRWLRRLGTRLDGLSDAATNFMNEHPSAVTDKTGNLLKLAEAGKNDQISVMARGLASLMESSAERDNEQRAYLQTLDLLQDAVIEFSTDGHLLRATDTWRTMTGQDDLSSCGILNCVHPEDSNELLEQFSALTHEQKSQINIRFRMLREHDINKYYWVEGRFAAVKHHGKITNIRGVVRDITTTYRQERQISHMALHDALTDLPNRVLLEDRLEMAITRAARTGQRVALGFIDLDHFKQVNDNFGHKLGDLMLKEVTHRLHSALRGTDTLSRWGGDEFVVLCPDLNSLEDARDITQKLTILARKYITIDGTDFPFTFSAGFAVYPDDAGNSEMLLAQADRAMFYAKAQGRNNIQFFNTIAGKETGRLSFYIQSRLVQAINDEQILCWLQPIMSAQTGKVLGMEALARWHEPEQGWIPPSVFIPMAESMGMIDKLGQSVWRQALYALTLMPDHYRLSVNLSKRQLFSNTIVQQLCEDIAHKNILPGRIMLEITESIALSDVTYARERIAELDSRGFGISIDDFGVGYSSLSQLHEIPADELKLDISFVKRIHEKSGFGMATAIISIAKSLNLECVAEGVENAHTANLLSSMGVEGLQGYHYAKPMPIDDFLAWQATSDNK